MARPTIAQINVRLSMELKESGDRGLRDLGRSPSDVVRALWRRLAERGEGLAKIESLLFGDERGEGDGVTTFDESPIAQGWRMVEERIAEIGIEGHSPVPPASCDDGELLARALEDRMRERGLM